MSDEITKRAAQEYLATRLSEEGQTYEDKLNTEAAIALAPKVWSQFVEKVSAKCNEWNAVTKEQSLTCKETMMGDLRISCAGRPHVLTVHYDPRKRVIALRNSARPEHEKDMVLQIAGYANGETRDARLTHDKRPANLDVIIVGELRVLAGLNRQTN